MIVSPHSGFLFSGSTASWAYKFVKPIEKYFIALFINKKFFLYFKKFQIE